MGQPQLASRRHVWRRTGKFVGRTPLGDAFEASEGARFGLGAALLALGVTAILVLSLAAAFSGFGESRRGLGQMVDDIYMRAGWQDGGWRGATEDWPAARRLANPARAALDNGQVSAFAGALAAQALSAGPTSHFTAAARTQLQDSLARFGGADLRARVADTPRLLEAGLVDGAFQWRLSLTLSVRQITDDARRQHGMPLVLTLRRVPPETHPMGLMVSGWQAQ